MQFAQGIKRNQNGTRKVYNTSYPNTITCRNTKINTNTKNTNTKKIQIQKNTHTNTNKNKYKQPIMQIQIQASLKKLKYGKPRLGESTLT